MRLNNCEEAEKALEILGRHNSILRGSFVLSSGKISDTYVQLNSIMNSPEDFHLICNMLASKIKSVGHKYTAVIAPAVGAIIAGYEVARALGVRYIFCERGKDGIMSLRRGFVISPKDSVLILDNVLTTGLTIGEVTAIVNDYGGCIDGISVIVDRSGGSFANNTSIPFISLVRIETEEFDAIPAHLAHLTPFKPGSR